MRFSVFTLFLLVLAVDRVLAQSTDGSLQTINLASDKDWTLSVDGGPTRGIKVPGGGYNSDLQDQPWIARDSVKKAAVYERTFTAPSFQPDQVVLLEFGAVNYGAEVYLVDGTKEQLVATHEGPMMPFSAELTPYIVPGKTYVLKVRALPRSACKTGVPSGFIYPDVWSKPENGWACRFSGGITKFVRLAVYPAIRIADVFVRTSVSNKQLSAEVTIHNYTSQTQNVTLRASLSPWKHASWDYPSLPDSPSFAIPARSDGKFTIGPVSWSLDSNSYWWPNKPFREDYEAVLHNLDLTLQVENRIEQTRTQRFGFVEWTEGPFYYRVNGVRINYLSDATPEAGMSEYDCYSTSPAFLPPTTPGTGCPETWRRYMRLGFCSNRIHQSTPTPYMMDTADELGFMLIPETGIRGFSPGLHWDKSAFTQAEKELAMVCRGHPSVCRYSVQNECSPAWVGEEADALVAVDNTRPLVFEDSVQKKAGVRKGLYAHAYPMLHYMHFDAPLKEICGMGESAWPQPGPEKFVAQAMEGRCLDACYYSGWDWLNYWPNFLQGMTVARHAWKQANSFYPKDRQDGIDGWNSPLMNWVQTALSPYLVLDRDFYRKNGPFDKDWPKQIPVLRPGSRVERKIVVFNDALFGNQIGVAWETHWDSAKGELVASGNLAIPTIEPGFHASTSLVFVAPPARAPRTLFLTLTSVKNGQTVFVDDKLRFVVKPNS